MEVTVNAYRIIVKNAVFLSEIFLARKYNGIIVRVEKKAEKNLPITFMLSQLVIQEAFFVRKKSISAVNR